jgi:hypothetical protein
MIGQQRSGLIFGLAVLLLCNFSCVGQQAQPATANTVSSPGDHSESEKNDTPMNPCNKAIQQIQNLDFHSWTGLPADCDWTELTGPLPSDWSEIAQRSLGSEFREAKMIMLPIQGYYRPSMSFVDGKAVLFEAMAPEFPEGGDAALIAEMGSPAARLDWDFGTLPCPASEFVYPKRGITLFLGDDLKKVLHVALYAATSLEEYNRVLRPRLGKTLRPMK